MRLIKPGWLGHRDENRVFEVYSLDVSSDDTRLVTGGLDSKVKIWSTRSVAHPESNEPKLLASMAAHTGAVTAVKFSPDARFVASGSDDRIVLVSELDPGRQPRRREFGSTSTDPEEREVWTPRKRLVGHDNDIQDLAWSPDGQLLVSVGLDSSIIVWSGQTFEKIKRLDWHQSHVKGVCFDPANKFFVACADDRTARVVRYSRASPTELSFSIEAVVSTPFVDSPLTTYFRRCSWSPDGETIACPNATNGPVPTVAVIERGQWTAPGNRQVSLVGHEGTTEVARFSPRQYEQADGTEVCIVATAGEDGKIAVWSTGNPRPLVIVQNVCAKLITDLAWSRSGTQLYASSLDGSVVLLEFNGVANDGLGKVVSLEKTLERLAKYGNATDLMDIPQSVEQVEVARAEANAQADNSTVNATPTTLPRKEETKPSPKPVSSSPGQEPAHAQSDIKPETAPAADSAAAAVVPGSANADPVQSTSTSAALPATTTSSTPPPPSKPIRQKTSVTKEGRKRVAPMLLNSQPPPANGTPQANTALTPVGVSHPRGLMPVYDRSVVYDSASSALPPGGIHSLIIGNKRRSDDEPQAPKRVKEDTSYLRPVALNPSTSVSQIRLATPRVISHLSSDVSADAVLEARNASKAGEPTRVTLVVKGRVVFVDYIAEYASLLAGSSESFWAVASDTGVVYLYSPEGTRACVPLVLGAPLAILESRGYYLCALTANGMLHAWDFSPSSVGGPLRGKSLFPSTSIGPCLDLGQRFQDNGLVRGPQVTQCWITENGQCLLSLSTGAVFHYNSDMMVFTRVSEGFWAYGSQFWDSTGLVHSGETIGPVIQAELRTNEEALLKSGARGRQLQRQAVNRSVQAGFQGFEQSVSTSHLANRVAAARELRSPELKRFLVQFVRRLAERGDRLRLGEVFREVRDEPELLNIVLKTAAEFKGVQEMVAEYSS